LEGLEISEVNYLKVINDNDWHRFDPEYFKKKTIRIIDKIKSGKYKLIGDCFEVSKLAGFEFTKYFTPKNMESPNNYIALTSKNIQREQLKLYDYITIDKVVADTYLSRSKILYEDVVLSYTGEYRRSLVMLDKAPYQLGPNICRIRSVSDSISPYYLSAFLNSNIGQTILDREKTLSAQPTVAMSRIRKIPIPIIANQERLQEYLRDSFLMVEKAKICYEEAINLLYDKLGIKNGIPKSNLYTVKNFSDIVSSGRIDAEYYQSKYDYLEEKIKSMSYKTVADLQIFNARGVQPNYISDGDVSVVNSKHILENGLDYDNFEKTSSEFLKQNERARIRENDILIYTTGANIGRAQPYMLSDYAVASNHVNILRLEGVNPIYAALLLNSIVGRLQTEKACTGSAQVELYPADLEKFLIPILPKEQQESIAEKVIQSFALRTKSKELLEMAKKKVEDDIYEISNIY